MIKKTYSNINVVEAAKIRIKNAFETANELVMSLSGGKDSACMNDIVYQLCKRGEIDKSKLTVQFIDEEAIYPCVEEVVKKIRLKWLELGVKFDWYCIQVKHYNCLNQLTNDESYICWDETKKDVWVRKKPPFAISTHPLLNERHETYQSFLTRLNKGKVQIIGIRVNESIQRLFNVASYRSQEHLYPIYDWTDNDVWRYIKLNNVDFAKAYIYMYQTGVSKRRLRISQFFSIDTIGSLVNMCEYYPNLFDKICEREPNAYLAMLYYDTELFRHKRKSKNEEEIDNNTDYKKKLYDTLKEDWRFQNASMKKLKRAILSQLRKQGVLISNDGYKKIYESVLAGDPKLRVLRAVIGSSKINLMKHDRKRRSEDGK